MYTELFGGLRGYYASYPNRKGSAGFEAAMTLSFIGCINVGSLLVLGNFIFDRDTQWADALFANKLLLLVVGIGVVALHVGFAKTTGKYASVEPVTTVRWKRYLVIYGCCSALAFAAAITIAFSLHRAGS